MNNPFPLEHPKLRSLSEAQTVKEKKCAEMVWHQDGMRFGNSRQCTRNAGFGPDEAYCAQHAEKFTKGESVTWYRASCFTRYSCEITPVQVLKETETMLLIKDGNRASKEKKESRWYRYFAKRSQAVEFYRSRIRGLRAQADKLEATVNALAK